LSVLYRKAESGKKERGGQKEKRKPPSNETLNPRGDVEDKRKRFGKENNLKRIHRKRGSLWKYQDIEPVRSEGGEKKRLSLMSGKKHSIRTSGAKGTWLSLKIKEEVQNGFDRFLSCFGEGQGEGEKREPTRGFFVE